MAVTWLDRIMAQLEYSDYYKFTASAGIALIAGAVLIPWAFLREPFDLTLEIHKIALLTDGARTVVIARQSLVGTLMHWVPRLSICMAVIGGCLTSYGLIGWRSRQNIRDEMEDEDLKRKRIDNALPPVSPGQIDKEAELEAKAEQEAEAPEDVSIVVDAIQAAAANRPSEPIIVLPPGIAPSSVAVEQVLLSRISTCLAPEAQVLTNRRLENVVMDAVVRPPKGATVIVEIKYIRRGFNHGWMEAVITNLTAMMALFRHRFGEPAEGLLLVVIATTNSPLARKALEFAEDVRRSHPAYMQGIRVRTIYEVEIPAIACDDLRRLIVG